MIDEIVISAKQKNKVEREIGSVCVCVGGCHFIWVAKEDLLEKVTFE